MICKICGKSDVIKAGFSHGRQRYKCKNCSFHFVEYPKRLSENNRLRVVRFCSYGVSMNTVAKMFSITVTTVTRWAKWYKKYPNQKELLEDESDRSFARLLAYSSSKDVRRRRVLNFQITQLIRSIQNYQNVKPEKII